VDERLLSREEERKRLFVRKVAFHDANARGGSDGRPSHQRRDLVAGEQELGHDSPSGEAGGSRDGDAHGSVPPLERAIVTRLDDARQRGRATIAFPHQAASADTLGMSQPTPAPRGGFAALAAAIRQAWDVSSLRDGSPAGYKREARRNWTAVPCGTDVALAQRHTREYFDEIERYRYRTQPWTAEAIDRLAVKGRRVLELGFGAGTDHLRLVRNGAWLAGVDITPQNFVETQRHFAHAGARARLAVGDAGALPLRSGVFDLVYSFGVVHHVPEIDGALRELARVLAPGGRAWVAVYHRRSVFFWWSVFGYRHLLRRGYRRRSLRAQLSLVERPNSNEGLVVYLHSRREIVSRFEAAGFDSVRAWVTHLVPADVAGLDVLLSQPERPRAWLSWLGRFWGWYVVVEARKA
jgi:ubiquinone/menaquinone biosynthesis C-methylase UbiE